MARPDKTTVHPPPGESKPQKKKRTPLTGQQRKERGTRRALENNAINATALQISMVEFVQEHKRGTVDDATAADRMRKKFPHRGPWRGAAMSALVVSGILRVVAYEHSRRPFRHHGLNRVYAAVNPSRLPDILTQLRAKLKALTAGDGKGAE